MTTDTLLRQHEDQWSISRWATATFGEVSSDARVAARVNEELAELLRAITAEKPAGEIAEEAADAAIVMCRLGTRLGADVKIGSCGVGLMSNVMLHATTASSRLLTILEFCWTLQLYPSESAFTLQRQRYSEAWRELMTIFDWLAVNAQDAIDTKMAINRQRVWKKDGNGHGYHLRVKDPGPAGAGGDDLVAGRVRAVASQIKFGTLIGNDEVCEQLEQLADDIASGQVSA